MRSEREAMASRRASMHNSGLLDDATCSLGLGRRGKRPNIPSVLGGVISTNESIFGQVKSPFLLRQQHPHTQPTEPEAEAEAGCQNGKECGGDDGMRY